MQPKPHKVVFSSSALYLNHQHMETVAILQHGGGDSGLGQEYITEDWRSYYLDDRTLTWIADTFS